MAGFPLAPFLAMKKSESKSLAAGLRTVSPYIDLGMRFALAAGLGGVAGYWLDGKLHSSPLGLILGVMLGGAAGFINLYHNVMRLTRSEKAQRRASKKAGKL